MQLAHALIKCNALVLQVVVTMCAALDFFKADRNRRSLFKGSENVLVMLHVPGQHIYGNIGDFPALGLRYVKDRYHLKGGYRDFLFLGYGLSVLADKGFSRLRVDFVLAISTAMLVYSFVKNNRRLKAILTYSAVLLSATVIFNSSFWAQCDSIYTSFIILAILFLHKDKPIASFVFIGIAFAFKLQTVFIIPVLLYYWISTKKISILHFFIIPAVDVIMCLPAIIMGRPFIDIITIYAEQTDYGKLIQMNCPNFYALICDGNDMTYYYLFKQFSVFLTIAVLGIMMCIIIYKKVDLKNLETFLLTTAWTVFTCIMFLSSMHERYGYLLDIILIVYAAVSAKHLWIPIVSTLISLRGYCYYLFSYELISLQFTAIIYTALYVYITFLLVKTIFRAKSSDNVFAKTI